MSIDRTIVNLNELVTAYNISSDEDVETITSAVDYLREYAELIIDIWSKVGNARWHDYEHIE